MQITHASQQNSEHSRRTTHNYSRETLGGAVMLQLRHTTSVPHEKVLNTAFLSSFRNRTSGYCFGTQHGITALKNYTQYYTISSFTYLSNRLAFE